MISVPYKNLNLLKINLSEHNSHLSRWDRILIEVHHEHIKEIRKNLYQKYADIEMMGKQEKVSEFLSSVKYLFEESNTPEYINTKFYLKNVVACYRKYGWGYKSREKNTASTHTLAMQNIEYRQMKAINFMGHKEWVEPSLRDIKFVERSFKWAYSAKDTEPFLDNIITITKNLDYISLKDCPTVALLIKMFDKVRREKIVDVDFQKSEPLAMIDDEIEIVCTVIRRKDFFRFTWFSLSDDNENKLTWFCETSEDADIGDRILINATVSDVRHHSGVCETVIKKVKVKFYE